MNKPLAFSEDLYLANTIIKDSYTTKVMKYFKEVYSFFDCRYLKKDIKWDLAIVIGLYVFIRIRSTL